MRARNLFKGLLLLLTACGAAPAASPQAPATAPAKAALLKSAPENLQDLRALQTQVQAIVAKVSPAIVGLRVGGGQGSGVIVSDDGYILTAGHVASAPDRDVTVILGNGKTVRAKTLGVNYGADCGMMKISSPPPGGGKWPFAEMGKSGDLQKGQWCIALGHPGGFRPGRSAPLRLGRILETRGNMIRTDCTLVGGDSGGPLFDLDGNVIAIHSRIGSSITDNQHVPVDSYLDTWDRLAQGEAWGESYFGGRPGSPWLGFQVDAQAPDCKIGEVFPGGPADKTGLKKGDVIITFGREKVANFGELALKLAARKPGDEVQMEIKRDDQTIKLTITISKRPR